MGHFKYVVNKIKDFLIFHIFLFYQLLHYKLKIKNIEI